MAKHNIKAVFDKAQQVLAARAESDLLAAFVQRYKFPRPFLLAVKEFDLCRYWQDAGFGNIAEYASHIMPNGRYLEWMGWSALAKADPPDDIIELVRSGALRPEKLSALHGVLTRKSYRTWLFLAMHLSHRGLRESVAEWRKLCNTGYLGDAIFVPAWIPANEYREIFNACEYGEDKPAWVTIKQALASSGKDKA